MFDEKKFKCEMWFRDTSKFLLFKIRTQRTRPPRHPLKNFPLVLQPLALLLEFTNTINAISVQNFFHQESGQIVLPDKTLKIKHVNLPDDTETDYFSSEKICPAGYTFPKPSTYLELMALRSTMHGIKASGSLSNLSRVT